MADNPWDVPNASVFMKFCCPECEYKCVALSTFKQHATKNHELSHILFHKTKTKMAIGHSEKPVKQEPICEISENTFEDDYDMVDIKYEPLCEVKIDTKIKKESYNPGPISVATLKRKQLEAAIKANKSVKFIKSNQSMSSASTSSPNQKSKPIAPHVPPKENGWWKCKHCPEQKPFFFFFELVSHWDECHRKFPITTKFGAAPSEAIIKRDVALANSNWTCYTCPSNVNFQYKFQLVTHWYEKHKKENHPYEICQWCIEVFDSPIDAFKHRKEVHPKIHYQQRTQPNPYYQPKEIASPNKCTVCDETFLLQEALLHHQKTIHAEGIDSFSCHSCPGIFYSKAGKIIHEMLHGESKDIAMVYPCNHCADAMFSISDIVIHHRQNHETLGLPFYQCDDCDFSSEKLASAKEHYKTVHGKTKYQPYKCQYCDTATRGPVSFLNYHMKYVHQNDPSACTCSKCNKVFKSKATLIRHKCPTDPSENLICDTCGYIAKHRDYLRKHVQRNHTDKLKGTCPFCGYSARKNYVEEHIDKMHQEVGGPLSHMCPDCGKGFIYKTSLTTHIYYKHKKKGNRELVGQGAQRGQDVPSTSGLRLIGDPRLSFPYFSGHQ